MRYERIQGPKMTQPTLNAGMVAVWFFQGILTSIAKKSYIFVIFRKGPDPMPNPLPLHTLSLNPHKYAVS